MGAQHEPPYFFLRALSQTVPGASKGANLESSRMRYPDGQTAQIGDRVHCWTGCTGTVIADMDGGHYLPGHEGWAYLKAGVMIDTDAAGLIHYTVPEDEMRLLSRTTSL